MRRFLSISIAAYITLSVITIICSCAPADLPVTQGLAQYLQGLANKQLVEYSNMKTKYTKEIDNLPTYEKRLIGINNALTYDNFLIRVININFLGRPYKTKWVNRDDYWMCVDIDTGKGQELSFAKYGLSLNTNWNNILLSRQDINKLIDYAEFGSDNSSVPFGCEYIMRGGQCDRYLLKPEYLDKYKSEKAKQIEQIAYAEKCRDNLPVLIKQIDDIKSLTSIPDKDISNWNCSRIQNGYLIKGNGLGVDSTYNSSAGAWICDNNLSNFTPSESDINSIRLHQLLSDSIQ